MSAMQTDDPNGARLAALWAAYRTACPDPEPGPEFLPRLWEKIEARRAEARSWFAFKRWAQACAAATAVLLVLMQTMLPAPREGEPLETASYADILAADHAERDYAQVLPVELIGVAR
jgi:anti-sigma-K factor RskA